MSDIRTMTRRPSTHTLAVPAPVIVGGVVMVGLQIGGNAWPGAQPAARHNRSNGSGPADCALFNAR